MCERSDVYVQGAKELKIASRHVKPSGVFFCRDKIYQVMLVQVRGNVKFPSFRHFKLRKIPEKNNF